MTYARVIPRDLFNEGNLLTCLGRLWIMLDERRGHKAVLTHARDHAFVVVQDPSDGSISCSTVALTVGGQLVPLFRGLNARDKWPLWARFGDLNGDFEDVPVFTIDGELTTDFWAAIRIGDDCGHCGGDGIEPATMTHDAGDGEGEDRPCSVCRP